MRQSECRRDRIVIANLSADADEVADFDVQAAAKTDRRIGLGALVRRLAVDQLIAGVAARKSDAGYQIDNHRNRPDRDENPFERAIGQCGR